VLEAGSLERWPGLVAGWSGGETVEGKTISTTAVTASEGILVVFSLTHRRRGP
jgi:hypothetical protein